MPDTRRAARSRPGGSAWLQALVEASTDSITVLDVEGRPVYWTPAAAETFGYAEDQEVGLSFDFVHPDDLDRVSAAFLQVITSPEDPVSCRFRMRRGDGSWGWVETMSRNRLSDPDVQGIVINTRDISERVEAEEALRESEERYRRLVERSPDLIAVHQDGVVAYVNPAGARMLGASSPDDLLGRSAFDFVHPEDHPMLQSRMAAVRSGEEAGLSEIRMVRVDGGVIDVEAVTVPVTFGGGRASQVMARDITDRKRAERALAHQALHDHLTGLPNRVLLHDRLSLALARCARSGCHVAVVFLDLDRFKVVNDSLGHEAGDRVLRAVSARITNVLRPADTLARFGGDEFVVVCDDIAGPAEATRIARRILDALGDPVDEADGGVHVGASIGVSLASGEGATAEDLVRDADAAMYRAKERGRGRIELFDEGMRSRLVTRLAEERRLRVAVAHEELDLHYQPVVALPGLEVVGVEGLVRWRHPERGVVAPAEFIPLAEESGLITDLGHWVLEEGCRQAGGWVRELGPDRQLEVALNLSTRQLSEQGLAKRVEALLDRHGLTPGGVALCLEITESFLLEDPVATGTVLDELRGLGVRLAIDDFGTGYSSLSYLRRFPLDALKIDRTFVSGLGVDSDSRAIASAIVEMAHALGLHVVAEGVEEEVQLEVLVELGCDRAQGFLFSHPVPAPQLWDLLCPEDGPTSTPGPRTPMGRR
jgi:diguanylate cyclase (GGDEF)-like protein/PAS domain S-box-containing protein